MNPTQIKAATTAQLVARYNKLTGKSITRFATRANAERRVMQLEKIKAKGDGKVVVSDTVVVKAMKTSPKPRKIKGAAGAAPAGRPSKEFDVKLLAACPVKLHENSLRQQVKTWLAKQKGTASIAAINTAFNRKMNGVVAKMAAIGHVECVE